MNDVFVAGAAMIRFGKHPLASYAGLAVPTLVSALRQAAISTAEVDAVYCGHAYGGMLTGQRICKVVGLGGVPVINVDNACSGGATAIGEAFHAVKSGRHEVVVALGVEKLTQFHGGTLPLPSEDREVRAGVVMPAIYGMRARRYLDETEATEHDLALVSVKARQHGALNPLAQMQKSVSAEEVLASRPIAEPLRLLMCCPTGDGAAAVVIVSERVHRTLTGPAMRILASILHSGSVAEGYRGHDPARN